MSKFFTYLKTKTFRTNLIIAVASVTLFLILIFYSLRYYTRHGEGVPVPKLQGLSVESAIALLESQGLNYQIDSIYQMDRPPGMVIEQDPGPNTNVKLHRTVYLTIITRIAPDVGFPDIFSKTFLEARAILSNYGLKIGDTSYISDIARDRVLQVEFRGKVLNKDEQIPKGSSIKLVLGDGKGASEVDLPNVIGLSLSEAIFSLRGSSLKPGNISYQNITDSATATVIQQNPALSDSLTKVSLGSSIDLILSNGTPIQ